MSLLHSSFFLLLSRRHWLSLSSTIDFRYKLEAHLNRSPSFGLVARGASDQSGHLEARGASTGSSTKTKAQKIRESMEVTGTWKAPVHSD